MRGSLPIGKVGGIPIRIHWSFGILVALVVVAYYHAGRSALLSEFLWLVAIFASVVVHELAHSVVARRRGHTVKDILLLPIGGVSEIGDMSVSAPDELRIAVVGPLTSVGVGLTLGLLGLVSGASLWPPTLFAGSFLARLMWVNLLLAVFNFLPALPLDGGRVLRAWLSIHRGEPAATLTAVRWARALGSAMVVLGILFDPWVALIGFFVIIQARSEGQASLVRTALSGLHVGDVMAQGSQTLPAELTVGDLAVAQVPHPERSLPVVGDGRYLGMVSAERMTGAPPSALIADITDRRPPLLDPSDELYPTALEAFGRARRPELAVGTDGHVLGMLYLEDVESLLRRPRQSRRTA